MTMRQQPRHVAVIDIGKTNAKLALVDLQSLSEIAVRKTPNTVLTAGLYPHYDCERVWTFILQGLADLQRQPGIDSISVTTHGVAAALLGKDGGLAMPVLDYEFAGPESTAGEYDAVRPPFAETGTPRLPLGLNLGAQLFWQQRAFRQEFARVARIVTYPQYWTWRLSGVLANEPTSLGCHTDLWDPARRDYSSLVSRMGWREKMAPVRRAGDHLGPLLPEVAKATGLAGDIPVFCGIHDSNASLYPHLLQRQAPFAVVSTGTWVIVMAVGAARQDLDPARDCLVNVDALGNPVPSARFMGGREFSMLVAPGVEDCADADLVHVLDSGIMLLPSVQGGSGPFPDRASSWLGDADSLTPSQHFAAVSLYLGMMTATCLGLAGAAGPVIVEGPFATNRIFGAMLSAATGREVLASAGSATGTSIGAALLAAGGMKPELSFNQISALDLDDRLRRYFADWQRVVG
jgi:sugar (pentulose or hexulose) kinase